MGGINMIIFLRIILLLLVTILPIVKEYSEVLCFINLGIIGLIFTIYEITLQNINYKKGQVDAYNGKMFYELKQQSDKSVKWTKKPLSKV